MRKILVILASILVLYLVACGHELENTITSLVGYPSYGQKIEDENNIEPGSSETIVFYDWQEWFNMSFHDLFDENEPEMNPAGSGMFYEYHPVYSDIMILFAISEYSIYDSPVAIRMPLNRLINKELINVDELSQLFGDDFSLRNFVHGNPNSWNAVVSLGKFEAIFYLSHEFDDNITDVEIRIK